jgi:cellulose synthase/poly-beta-1,6-N-acetylglucosamine synthase-like glycosyltransferase
VVIGSIARLIGPVKHLHENSETFSAVKSPRLTSEELPHVTIQCPVYKEGLDAVIKPTIRSVMKAISSYELQGGSASIFVNDDGLQLISEDQRLARTQFYQDNNIAWVARPAHDPKGTGFIRRGKFKKASNMNYALNFSNRIEEKLQALDRGEKWTSIDEQHAYERMLQQTLDETPEDQPRAWAGGNVRIGDYILLIDSDTRIPSDCLLDAVSEMEIAPHVAIVQFASGVMQVSHDFFENGMAFFTDLIYTSIRFGVAAGDIAPFVGHNALLRWSSLQHVSFEEAESPLPELYWSESTVSEDFDMALRLQIEGYQLRYASYFGDGFQEGVSLTVYDELTRWEKYAYGCDELMFHPFRYWLFRGPFTPLFRNFLFSNIPFCSKVNIVSYIGTYYALGAAWCMTMSNYIALGLFNGYIDRWYTDSWQIFISVVFVFAIGSNFALAVSRYRSGEKPFLSALYEAFAWAIMFLIFFGGISLHISQALLSHLFSIDMQVRHNHSTSPIALETPEANISTNLVGRHRQRSHPHKLLHRSPQNPPPIQIQHDLLRADDHRNYHRGYWFVHPLVVQHHQFHCNLPTGIDDGLPLVGSDYLEPGVAGVHLVIKRWRYDAGVIWTHRPALAMEGGFYILTIDYEHIDNGQWIKTVILWQVLTNDVNAILKLDRTTALRYELVVNRPYGQLARIEVRQYLLRGTSPHPHSPTYGSPPNVNNSQQILAFLRSRHIPSLPGCIQLLDYA